MGFKAIEFDFQVFDVTLFPFAEGALTRAEIQRVWCFKARREFFGGGGEE